MSAYQNNCQYWTTEYIYTNGRPTGLAAAFLGYLSDAVGLNDLADAGDTPGRGPDHPSAARLCAQPGSSHQAVPQKKQRIDNSSCRTDRVFAANATQSR
jgi:hypothetical protein